MRYMKLKSFTSVCNHKNNNHKWLYYDRNIFLIHSKQQHSNYNKQQQATAPPAAAAAFLSLLLEF